MDKDKKTNKPDGTCPECEEKVCSTCGECCHCKGCNCGVCHPGEEEAELQPAK
ncbi:hypothetical protein HOD29_05875 [archaeon]|jgi:hypothetical protein|nr:hypothetical protein [archaeon]